MATQLWYNGVALHSLGVVEAGGRRVTPSPAGELQTRWTVTWEVTLHLVGNTFAGNLANRDTVLAALRTPQSTLTWKTASGTTLDSRTATLEPFEWPVVPGGGNLHQKLVLNFAWQDTSLATTNRLAATWYDAAADETTTLGVVTGCTQSYQGQRVDDLHDARTRVGGSITLTGELLADTTQTLASRRSTLQAARDALVDALHEQPSGRLDFGTFSQTVRVTRFTADVGDAATAITWTLEAEYTRWPDETGYAIGRYEVREQTDRNAGTFGISVTGDIMAQSEVAARAELARILGVVVAAYSGKTLTETTRTVTPRSVAADTDGTVFTNLSFDVAYRVTLSASITERRLRMEDSLDHRAGLIRRSYSGTVTATAASWDAAYQAAWVEVTSLEASKHAMLVSGRVSVTDNTQKGGDPTGSSTVPVTVEFEMVYQITAGTTLYYELRTTRTVERFGDDREEVSGFIVAASRAAATSLWTNTIRAAYAGTGTAGVITEESFNEAREYHHRGSATIGTALAPPGAGAGWGATVNAGESAASATDTVVDSRMMLPPTGAADTARHWLRFEFRLGLFRPKPAGTAAIRYDLRIAVNYLTLERRTELNGTVWADVQASADTAIASLGSSFGTLIESQSTATRLADLGAVAGGSDDRPASPPEVGAVGYAVSFGFNRVYTSTLTGVASIVECSLTEDVEHSGTRYVVRPSAFGRDTVQACGYKSGSRTVRAMARAASESVARTWAVAWADLPFYQGNPSTRYKDPQRITSTPTFPPLASGTWTRGSGNARLYEVTVESRETLPDHDYVAGS